VPARPVTATRRTALAVAAGLAGLAVGGCTSDSPDDPDDPASTSAPPVDADQELVDGVVERLNTALGAVVTAGDASRPLARKLAGLSRMHVAHLEALGGSENWSADIGQAPDRQEVLAGETRLQKFLTTAAVRAESGTLAKLLASMSAAVAQHLAALG
jgi:hypothetical protein